MAKAICGPTQNTDIVRYFLQKLIILHGALVVYFSIFYNICRQGSCSDNNLAIINVTGLVALIVIHGLFCYLVIKKHHEIIVTPVVIFSAQSALFFGFGPLSFYFANEATRIYLQYSLWRITPLELTKVTLLSYFGIWCVLIGMLLVLRFLYSRFVSNNHHIGRSARSYIAPDLAIYLVIIGILIKFVFVLPNKFGMTETILPGAINNLKFMLDIGLAMIAYMTSRKMVRWNLVFWPIWIIHISIILLEFEKLPIIVAFIFPAIGAYLGNNNLKSLIGAMAVLVGVFIIYQPISLQGRYLIQQETGSIVKADLANRVRHLANLVTMDVPVLNSSRIGINHWWIRLNYSGAQSLAMKYRETGITKEYYQSPLIYLIPRFIWKDKPLSTQEGRLFSARVLGDVRTETATGITIYADSYWSMGWIGTLVLSLFSGIWFGLMQYLHTGWIYQEKLAYFPLIFLSIYIIGTSASKFFASGIVSIMPIYFGYIFLTTLLCRLVNYTKTNKIKN